MRQQGSNVQALTAASECQVGNQSITSKDDDSREPWGGGGCLCFDDALRRDAFRWQLVGSQMLMGRLRTGWGQDGGGIKE